MPTGKPPPYVAEAEPVRWVLRSARSLRWRLLALGFVGLPMSGTFKWSGRAKSQPEMAQLAMRLRDLGLSFGYGPGWAPSEVVERLKEASLFSGPHTTIKWDGPGSWFIS